MWRSVHSIIGLVAILFVSALAISGTMLATIPVLDAIHPAVQDVGDKTLADALAVLVPAHEDIDRLTRTSSGAFVLSHFGEDGPARDYIDIASGALLGPVVENGFFAGLRDFHRAFMLGSAGRIAAGCCAAMMALLCISGTFLLVRRLGGLRNFFAPVRGGVVDGLHAFAGRLTMVPLLISALTGIYLTLVTFQLLPNGQENPPSFPESVEELDYVAPWELEGLQAIALRDLREVTFPIPGDWFDVFAVKTRTGHVFVDQFTGAVLSEAPYHPSQAGLEWVTAFHTGEGMAWWGVLSGISALSVPLFAITGLMIWAQNRRRGAGRVAGNVGPRQAEIALLVGSESGSTWGFARHLHERLTEAGRKVHLAGMNQLRADYPRLQTMLVLTATYGDGHAPQSASRFSRKVRQLTPGDWRHAVLGFGDKAFAHFSRFAIEVDDALGHRNGAALLPAFHINRGSTQAFSHWGAMLGEQLGVPLALDYEPPRPATERFTLIARRDYGQAPGQLTTILRFAADNRLARHQAGDLIGVVPPGSNLARYYSLASRSADGWIEICVRLQDQGLCSGFLHGLALGDSMDGFVRINPDFHLPSGGKPVVLIGAGTGIAPLIGMARANRATRPMDLFWGGREPESDFLFGEEIAAFEADGRLRRFVPAFSRTDDRAYVQDRVRQHATDIASSIAAGASVLVCGSPQMAAAVAAEIDIAVQPLSLSVAQLRRRDRYREDVF